MAGKWIFWQWNNKSINTLSKLPKPSFSKFSSYCTYQSIFPLYLHTDEELVIASSKFHDALAAGDYKSFCEMKANSSVTETDRQVTSIF